MSKGKMSANVSNVSINWPTHTSITPPGYSYFYQTITWQWTILQTIYVDAFDPWQQIIYSLLMYHNVPRYSIASVNRIHCDHNVQPQSATCFTGHIWHKGLPARGLPQTVSLYYIGASTSHCHGYHSWCRLVLYKGKSIAQTNSTWLHVASVIISPPCSHHIKTMQIVICSCLSLLPLQCLCHCL